MMENDPDLKRIQMTIQRLEKEREDARRGLAEEQRNEIRDVERFHKLENDERSNLERQLERKRDQLVTGLQKQKKVFEDKIKDIETNIQRLRNDESRRREELVRQQKMDIKK